MKLVYIAGPYRALNAWEVEQNIRRAEQWAYRIASEGFFPVCPHTNTRGYFESLQTAEFWLEGTLALMKKCDLVYAIPGWQLSTGAQGEVAAAQVAGIPVIYGLKELLEWI